MCTNLLRYLIEKFFFHLYAIKLNVFFVVIILFTSAGVSSQEDSQLRIMSFNVKYDNPNDGSHSWRNRKLGSIDMIRNSLADIIGFQEVLHSQLLDMTEALPDFKYVGVGRKDGATEGEYSPILYRSDRFEVLNSGTFWLSESPDSVASVGWDAAMERICTWAVFMDKRMKEKIAVFNTHFDHKGEEARHSSSDLILNRIEKMAMDLPIILTGDFNADSDSRTIQKLTSDDFLVDSRNLCSQVSGPNWTFHGFGKVPENERTRIDFIFFRKDFFNVVSHSHLFQSANHTFYSDHNPVLTVLHRTIKNE